MNLIGVYYFSLHGSNFFFEINWNFNIFYLKSLRMNGSIFIDSSLHYVNEKYTSILIASEIDYGNLLDFIDLLTQEIENSEYQEIVSSNSSILMRNHKFLKINIKNNIQIIEFDHTCFMEIKNLKNKIIEDFKIFSKKVNLIEDLILLTD